MQREALNKKQLAFINEYFINGFNGKAAYKAVYKNVTDESAEVLASKLLSNVKVKDEIAKRQALIQSKYDIKKEEIIEVVKHILFTQKDAFPPSSLKAAEILNKMFGWNASDKIEHSGNVGLDIKIISPEEDDSPEE